MSALIYIRHGDVSELIALAIIIVIIVTIIFPVFLMWLLSLRRGREVRWFGLKLTPHALHPTMEPIRIMFKPMFKDFLSTREWFCILTLVKALSLSLIITFVDDPMTQSAIFLATIFSYAAVLITSRPYSTRPAFVLDGFMISVDGFTQVLVTRQKNLGFYFISPLVDRFSTF